MSKPLFALRKGDVMATVLQWLKQENFHMPAAMLASAASDQKLEVAAPERVPPAHLEALLQLAMAQAHGVPSEKIAALGGPHDVDLLAEWKSTPLHAALQTLAATATALRGRRACGRRARRRAAEAGAAAAAARAAATGARAAAAAASAAAAAAAAARHAASATAAERRATAAHERAAAAAAAAPPPPPGGRAGAGRPPPPPGGGAPPQRGQPLQPPPPPARARHRRRARPAAGPP